MAEYISRPAAAQASGGLRGARAVPILSGMYVARACSEKGCGRPALSGTDACVVHCADAASHVAAILREARKTSSLRDMDLVGITVVDADLSGVEISGCRLTAASLTRVVFTRSSIQLTFFDRASIRECSFSGSTIINSVFGGSLLEECSFEDCELVQGNFLGIRGIGVRFDHSNLYGSRFVGAWLERVSMKDCNVTRVHFDAAHRAAVELRSSNTAEAVFLEEEP